MPISTYKTNIIAKVVQIDLKYEFNSFKSTSATSSIVKLPSALFTALQDKSSLSWFY